MALCDIHHGREVRYTNSLNSAIIPYINVEYKNKMYTYLFPINFEYNNIEVAAHMQHSVYSMKIKTF